jgi:glc operon protein GlcG
MSSVVSTYRLTHQGALNALHACIAHADKLGTPVTISIVDASGLLLAAARMDGAFFLSIESSLNKAKTAAACFKPTGGAPDMIALKLGLATFGQQTIGMLGGVPILVKGHCVGGIGAGSATGEQDHEISLAGLATIDDAKVDF